MRDILIGGLIGLIVITAALAMSQPATLAKLITSLINASY